MYSKRGTLVTVVAAVAVTITVTWSEIEGVLDGPMPAVLVSIVIGLVASVISNMAAHWRSKSTLDDTLDVFPCHGVGGMVGMVCTGIFATEKGLNVTITIMKTSVSPTSRIDSANSFGVF